DDVGNLLSRFGIDDSAKFWGTARRIAKHTARIGNHADLDSANTRVAGDDLFRIVHLKLIEMSFIEETVQNVPHVVWLTMILGKDFVALLRGSAGSRIAGRRVSFIRGSSASVSRPRHLRNNPSYPDEPYLLRP